MPATNFEIRNHTCEHEVATPGRRKEENSKSYRFPRLGSTCKKHVKDPALHPNCGQACPAFGGSPTNDDDWERCGATVANNYPMKVNEIPLKIKLEADCNEIPRKRKSGISGEEGKENSVGQVKKARLSSDSQPEVERFQSTKVVGSRAAEVIDHDPPYEIQAGNTVSASSTNANKVARKYVKHDTYWFLNGDILVQIGKVRFKLHSNTLVKHSQWFRDTIENEPHDRCIFVDGETGSAVYCLHSLDVDANDFSTLLNAIDNAISFAHNKQHPRTIAAILRAADELDFDQFKTFAMFELEGKWPSGVDDVTITRIPYAADTVLLARRCNAKSILKRALYELVRAEGFQQETTEELDDNAGDDGLGKSDYSLLVHIREKLVDFWMKKATPPSDPSTCLSPSDSSAVQNCAVSKRQTFMLYGILVHDSKIFSKYKYDPMCGLDALYDAPWVRKEKWSSYHGKDLPISEGVHLCPACSKKWRSTWAEEQKKLWWDLDTWLELNDEEE